MKQYSLENEYRKISSKGIHKHKKWPKSLKEIKWEEGFEHPMIATVYLDIRRFTKRVIHNPEKTFLTLQLFYLSVWKILEKYNCYVEKQTGDGLMIVFPIDDEGEIERPIEMAK